MPGVTMRNSRPHSLRMRAISCGEATTPSMPASRASRARRTTWLSTPLRTPTRRRSSCVEAGQHGDREQLRPPQVLGAADLVHLGDRLPHHRDAARGVQVEHAHAEARRLDAGLGHRARDVVELEIEEDVAAVLA